MLPVRPTTSHALLQATNRRKEAEPWYRRALAIDEQSLGPEHPNFATGLNNLATLLQATNRLGEAEPLIRRALAIREKALEIDNPKIIQSLEFLAGLLEATGRFEEAGPLRQRVFEAQARRLGPEHPDTLRNWNNYCFELRKQGHAGHSEPIARRVSATTAKVLGNTHPLTLHRRNNLVLTLILLGRLEEARQILAADWSLNAPPHANTTLCLAFLRHVIALLESQPDTPYPWPDQNPPYRPPAPTTRARPSPGASPTSWRILTSQAPTQQRRFPYRPRRRSPRS